MEECYYNLTKSNTPPCVFFHIFHSFSLYIMQVGMPLLWYVNTYILLTGVIIVQVKCNKFPQEQQLLACFNKFEKKFYIWKDWERQSRVLSTCHWWKKDIQKDPIKLKKLCTENPVKHLWRSLWQNYFTVFSCCLFFQRVSSYK